MGPAPKPRGAVEVPLAAVSDEVPFRGMVVLLRDVSVTVALRERRPEKDALSVYHFQRSGIQGQRFSTNRITLTSQKLLRSPLRRWRRTRKRYWTARRTPKLVTRW